MNYSGLKPPPTYRINGQDIKIPPELFLDGPLKIYGPGYEDGVIVYRDGTVVPFCPEPVKSLRPKPLWPEFLGRQY